MRPTSASEWRDFWSSGGARELTLLLWAVWDPIGGGPVGDYTDYATRVATLLGSRAPVQALAAELGRIRAHDLGLPADPAADEAAAAKIQRWFDQS
jgi:hypothetical protein